MYNNICTKLAALSLVALAGSPLWAQSANEDTPDETTDTTETSEASETTLIEDGNPITWVLTGGTIYSDETDFDDDSGTLKSWRTSLGIGAEMDLGEGRWSIGVDAVHTNYEFTTVSGGGGGGGALRGGGGGGGAILGVFDDVTNLTLNSSYRGQINGDDSWFIGAIVNAAYESGAEFDDSISGGVFGGYRHKVNDKLDLGIGLVVRTRLEDSVLILPLPQIRYDMGNGWILESQRVGLRVMYAMSDSLSYGISGEYESVSFRLDDSNAIAAGAATETRIPVAFEVLYKPNSKFRVHGRVGAALGSELEFFDTDGNTVSQRDLETSIFFGLSGSFVF